MRRLADITIAVVLALAVAPCAIAGNNTDTSWHVTLTWQDQSDLNLYMTGPLSREKRFMLSPWKTSAAGQARLETDSRPGPGRESATIDSQIEGVYQFYVYDQSACDEPWNNPLSGTGARVDLYSGPRLVQSFAVPVEGGGNLWTVFSLFGHQVTRIDNLTVERDPRKVGTTVRSALVPGDILLGRIPESLVPGAWSHVGIYAGDGLIIEAASENENVSVRTDTVWEDPAMTWVSYVRVVTADTATRKRAVAFAQRQVDRQCPYDIRFYAKQANGGSWYCSELVWAAYLNASRGGIDLENTPDNIGVYPWEIERDSNVALIGGHYEKEPERTIKVAFLYVKLVWNHMTGWIGDGWRWLWK